MKPQAPTRFFDMPFAQEGDYTIPKTYPDESTEGRTTLSEGFPEVTQLPVAKGGIAPNRWDFNGMYYMLSCFAFWAQSGGLMTWNSTLSYVPPAMVYYNGVLYVCIAENGPESDMGESVRPTEDTEGQYWQTLLSFLSSSENQVLVGQGNTVTLSEDATGTGTFDAEGNVTVPTTVEKASALRIGRGITLTGDTTGTVTFDGSEDVSMETTTAVATKLRTARDIKLSGAVTGSITTGNKFDGTGDVTITTTLASGGAMVPTKSRTTIEAGTLYTANSNGYVCVVQHSKISESFDAYVYIGGTNWGRLHAGGYGSGGQHSGNCTYVPVPSGTTYQVTGDFNYAYFYTAD